MNNKDVKNKNKNKNYIFVYAKNNGVCYLRIIFLYVSSFFLLFLKNFKNLKIKTYNLINAYKYIKVRINIFIT